MRERNRKLSASRFSYAFFRSFFFGVEQKLAIGFAFWSELLSGLFNELMIFACGRVEQVFFLCVNKVQVDIARLYDDTR
jgi:hypothetical protein